MIIGLTVLLKLRLTTDGHTMTAYAALAKRRAVKKKPLRIAVPLKYRQHAYRYTANGEGKWKEEKERRDGKG